MSGIKAICKRELCGYFQTPVAYVFMVVFLIASGAFTFYLGNYFNRGVADLEPFFRWHPWLYLILVPAVTMRLWAEERHSGTVELVMTLPVELWQVVVGKFLAAWIFVAVTLVGTFPIWITVNYLGNPDNGIILVGYLGSVLMAGAYLAIGSAMSATTSNQVIAFILAATLNLIFVMAGFSLVTSFLEGWLPQFLLEVFVAMSFLTNFDEMTRGVMEARSLIFFISFTVFWLYITLIILEQRKGR
jgi:ABC-2 type transport system permease protein